jgi:hypothetical protein
MTTVQLETDTTPKFQINTIPRIQKKAKNKILHSGYEFEVIKGFEAGWSNQRIVDHLKDILHFTACWDTVAAYKADYYDPVVKGGRDAGSIRILKMIESAEIGKYVHETAYATVVREADYLRASITEFNEGLKKMKGNEELWATPALLGRYESLTESRNAMQARLDVLVAAGNEPAKMKAHIYNLYLTKMLKVVIPVIIEAQGEEKAKAVFDTFVFETKYI